MSETQGRMSETQGRMFQVQGSPGKNIRRSGKDN